MSVSKDTGMFGFGCDTIRNLPGRPRVPHTGTGSTSLLGVVVSVDIFESHFMRPHGITQLNSSVADSMIT